MIGKDGGREKAMGMTRGCEDGELDWWAAARRTRHSFSQFNILNGFAFSEHDYLELGIGSLHHSGRCFKS